MKPQNLCELAAPYYASLFEKSADSSGDPLSLVEPLDSGLHGFQRDALLMLGRTDIVGEACYLLSTVSDEWMLKTFGLAWTRMSMLVRHHGDARGGERCWDTLERLMLAAPEGLQPGERQLLELYEVSIALGWRGRYRMLPDGEERVHDLRVKLNELLHAVDTDAVQTRALIALSTEHLDRRQRHLGAIVAGVVLATMFGAVMLVQSGLNRQWEDLAEILSRAPETSVLKSRESQP